MTDLLTLNALCSSVCKNFLQHNAALLLGCKALLLPSGHRGLMWTYVGATYAAVQLMHFRSTTQDPGHLA